VFCQDALRLGDLYGNRFELVLRDVDALEDQLKEACDSLAARGFINYYGLQRFGTSAVPTHLIGRALLQDDFATAADLILRPRAGEKEESTSARERFQREQKVGEALSYFPRYMHAERALLEGYRKNGDKSHMNAVQGIPRNLRLMYVHAYQSYIWNCMVSARVRLYGMEKAVPGDLVLVGGNEDEPGLASAEADESALLESDKGGGGDGKRWTSAHPKTVKRLSEEEAATTSIFDVVLPLPGTSVEYPTAKGISKEDYAALMKEDGLDVDQVC
jgi:tRNA pseudouridine13 synthase